MPNQCQLRVPKEGQTPVSPYALSSTRCARNPFARWVKRPRTSWLRGYFEVLVSFFHVGNTGSNPVGDTIKPLNLLIFSLEAVAVSNLYR